MLATPLQLITIAVKSLIGGIVGYFTNDLAIKMLFKKKFGIGGVVVKTRVQFIENATDLVEEDVLTNESLTKEIEKETFKNILATILKDYTRDHLPSSIPAKLTFSDLDQFEKSYEQLIRIITEHIESPLVTIFEAIAKELKLGDLISDKQARFLVGNMVSILSDLLKTPDLITPFLKALLKELESKNLNDLIPEDAVEQLAETLGKLTVFAGKELKLHFDGEIDQLFLLLVERFSVESLCHQVALSLSEKKWSDRIGNDRIEQVIAIFLDRMIALVKSDRGYQLLQNLSRTILGIVKNTDKTLFDLVPDQIAVKFEGFIYLRLVELIIDVTRWIEEKRDEIEVMINLSFADRNFVGMLLHSIGISLAEVFDVVNLIKDYVNGKIDLDQLADTQSREFVKLLKKNTLTQILSKLEQNSLLTEHSLTDEIKNTVCSLLEMVQPNTLRSFLNQGISEFVAQKQMKRVLVLAASKYFSGLLKNSLLYHDRFATRIRDGISDKIKRLQSQTVGQLFKEHHWNAVQLNPQAFLTSKLDFHQKAIASFFTERLFQFKQSKTIVSLLGRVDTLKSQAIEKLKQLLVQSQEKVSQLKLRSLYLKFNGNVIDDDLVSDVHQLILKHLHILTKGSVKNVSKNNLLRLSADQLCTVVENFMGKELKPITRFGAGLGLIAGAGLSLLPSVRGLGIAIGVPPLMITLSLSALMFGLIGWGTNWLALKMIFRPYLTKHIFGKRIPLTPGVVSQHKTRFATKMGQFVANHLLRKDSIESMFHRNNDRIKTAVKTAISRENYQIIDHQTRNHQSYLARRVSLFIMKRLGPKNPGFTELMEVIISRVSAKSFDQLPIDTLTQKLILLFHDNATTIKEGLQNWLSQDETQTLKLSSLLGQDGLRILEQLLNRLIADLIDEHGEHFFRKETFVKFIKGLEPRYNALIGQTIQNMISTRQFKQFRNHIFEIVLRLFNSRQAGTAVIDYLIKILAREVNPDHRFDELFGGKLMNFMIRNIDRLTHYFLQVALRYLRRNHQKISETVYQSLLATADIIATQAVKLAKNELFETIEDITKVRLPQFFQAHETSLQELIHKQVRAIGNTKINKVGTEPDEQKIRQLIDQSILNNKEVFRVSKQFIDELLHILAQERIGDYMEKIGLGRLDDVINLLDSEFQLVTDHLRRYLVLNRTQVADAPAKLINRVLAHLSAKTEIREILTGISPHQLSEIVDRVWDLLFHSGSFSTFGEELICRGTDHLKSKTISDLVDIETLKQDIITFIDRFLSRGNHQNEISLILAQALEQILPLLNQSINARTKDSIVDIGIDGFDLTLKQHLKSLFGAINFNEIVVTQINKMHPRKIEITFRKFAGQYFPKLINYGFGFGLVFGLMMDLFYFMILFFSN